MWMSVARAFHPWSCFEYCFENENKTSMSDLQTLPLTILPLVILSLGQKILGVEQKYSGSLRLLRGKFKTDGEKPTVSIHAASVLVRLAAMTETFSPRALPPHGPLTRDCS